jgi:hypothetical protein
LWFQSDEDGDSNHVKAPINLLTGPAPAGPFMSWQQLLPAESCPPLGFGYDGGY